MGPVALVGFLKTLFSDPSPLVEQANFFYIVNTLRVVFNIVFCRLISVWREVKLEEDVKERKIAPDNT